MTNQIFRSLLALAGASCILNVAQGFIIRDPLTKNALRPNSELVVGWLSTSEIEQASVISEYLVKAHEDKLKAIREVEVKKQAEIDALKAEMAQLRQSPSGSSIVSMGPGGQDLAALTKEQLLEKVLSYQQYMSEYIIKAQEEKVKAVKAAEEAISKKFLSAGSPSGQASAADTATLAIPSSAENKLYLERNAKISAAAAAGKSRWGAREIERVKNVVGVTKVSATTSSAPVTPAPAPVKPAAPVPVPPEVEAADHGLRHDGWVGGLSLAERVALGSAAGGGTTAIAAPVALSPNEILFQKRKAMVAAAAKAGKSRWGEMEVKKALDGTMSLSGSVASTPSGGAGTPTLAERVNLGAALLGK